MHHANKPNIWIKGLAWKKYWKLFKIYDKAKLLSMGADRDASLALVAKDQYVFSSSDSGEELINVKGGHHGCDPENPTIYTGFIAAGAGIKKGDESKK